MSPWLLSPGGKRKEAKGSAALVGPRSRHVHEESEREDLQEPSPQPEPSPAPSFLPRLVQAPRSRLQCRPHRAGGTSLDRHQHVRGAGALPLCPRGRPGRREERSLLPWYTATCVEATRVGDKGWTHGPRRSSLKSKLLVLYRHQQPNSCHLGFTLTARGRPPGTLEHHQLRADLVIPEGATCSHTHRPQDWMEPSPGATQGYVHRDPRSFSPGQSGVCHAPGDTRQGQNIPSPRMTAEDTHDNTFS